MKIFFDLLPVLLFFLAFKAGESNPQAAVDAIGLFLGAVGMGALVPIDQAPLLLATCVVMAATAVQVIFTAVSGRKVSPMLWASLVLVTVFGGLTLGLRSPSFIMLKPTMLYWLFAAILIVAEIKFSKNLVKSSMGASIALPEIVWAKLNTAWSVFFIGLGGLNLLVAFTYSIDTWINFKLFGIMALMIGFMMLQAIYMSKHLQPVVPNP